MKHVIFLIILSAAVGCKNNSKSENDQKSSNDLPSTNMLDGNEGKEKGLAIHPVEHASMVLQWDNVTIYVDPVGGKEAYSNYSSPDLVLITDIHSDHLDISTLESIVGEKTDILASKAVYEKLTEDLRSKIEVIENEFSTSNSGISIEAIPMYNLRKEALQIHPKGRGNGYVLEKNGERIYISGDTEDIPEMRNLKDIDIAFICMNLPYTMTVEKAAEAALAFKPKMVYPYHYRGENGFSEVEKFKELVEKGNPNIKVIQLDWYPK